MTGSAKQSRADSTDYGLLGRPFAASRDDGPQSNLDRHPLRFQMCRSVREA
jgi:hypothetical protein